MLPISKPIREEGKNSREVKGLDWTGEWCEKWERAEKGEWREKKEGEEGCSDISALWSRTYWDSWTFCQHSALQNQSLNWTKRERHTCAQSHTQHSHGMLHLMFSAFVQLQQGSLSASRQCVIAACYHTLLHDPDGRKGYDVRNTSKT